MAKILLSEGEVKEKELNSISSVVAKLQTPRSWLHEQKVDDLLDFLQNLGEHWNKELRGKIGINARHLSNFLSRENLEKKMDIALHGNRHALDKFIDLGDRSLLFHAQPRGIVAHWIAGNVDILGILSMVQSLVTKNVSIIKAPLNYNLLLDLLESFGKVKTDKIDGNDVLKCIEVIYMNHSEIKNQKELSLNADVRVAWGSTDAIRAITSLPKSPFTEDVIYGPKYSYVIVDEQALLKDKEQIAKRIAVDVSMFDQYACSSPHTVFIDCSNSNLMEDFSKTLAKHLDEVNRILIPNRSINGSKSLEILSLRIEYGMKGKVFSSKGVEWTVVMSNEKGLAEPTFSRVVHVRPFHLDSLLDSISRKIQTVGIVMDRKKRLDMIDSITFKGGDRCPNVGEMSLFESPWDGMFGMDRMVRWITTYKEQ